MFCVSKQGREPAYVALTQKNNVFPRVKGLSSAGIRERVSHFLSGWCGLRPSVTSRSIKFLWFTETCLEVKPERLIPSSHHTTSALIFKSLDGFREPPDMTQVDAGSVVVQQHVNSPARCPDSGHGRKLGEAVAEAFPASVLAYFLLTTRGFGDRTSFSGIPPGIFQVLKCLTPPVAVQSSSVNHLSTLTPDRRRGETSEVRPADCVM